MYKVDIIEIANSNKYKYINTKPYNYIYFDNFFEDDYLDKILFDFPSPNSMNFYEYNNPLEKKLAYDRIDELPKSISDFMVKLNSPYFLEFLEKLTNIEGLIPDPYFRGGGVHQIQRGGKLDIHIDFNLHPKLKLERRLNVIIYLNKNWEQEWFGDFQVWDGILENGKHKLVSMVERIYPIFNRLVVFSTSENSYHGHPEELMCPGDITRKSIALYYYTTPKSNIEPHSTSFVKIPGSNETEDIEILREKRNKGRLNNNI